MRAMVDLGKKEFLSPAVVPCRSWSSSVSGQLGRSGPFCWLALNVVLTELVACASVSFSEGWYSNASPQRPVLRINKAVP